MSLLSKVVFRATGKPDDNRSAIHELDKVIIAVKRASIDYQCLMAEPEPTDGDHQQPH